MPLPVITDTYRVAFNWLNSDFGSLSATNVMHFRKSGSNPAALQTMLDAEVTANMWAQTDTHSHIHDLAITPLDGSGVTYPWVTGSPAKWSGVQTDHDPLLQVAVIAKFVTAKRGRSYRGRAYLPWVTEAVTNVGGYDAGNKAAQQTAWITFLAAVVASGWQMVIASYKLSTAEPVVAIGIESYVATQRRRLVRTSAT